MDYRNSEKRHTFLGEVREAVGRFYQSALGVARYFLGADNVEFVEPAFAYAGIDKRYKLREDKGFDLGLAGLVSFMSKGKGGGKGGNLHHGSDIIRVHNPRGRDIKVNKRNCPKGTPLTKYIMEVAGVSRNEASKAIRQNGNPGKRKGRRKRH